jgi:hypothetical protein
MAKVAFYLQQRKDGGIRTGLDIDGERVASRLQSAPGSQEPDPALDWYVDVVLKGPAVPGTVGKALDWLSKHEAQIRTSIEAMAASIPAGVDAGEWPVRYPFRIGAVLGTIACSAVRRVTAQRLAAVLRDVAENWDAHLASLRVPQKV